MWCDNSRICHDAIQLRATKNGYPTTAKQLTASAQEPRHIASAHTYTHANIRAHTHETTNINSKFEEAFWQRRVKKRQPAENKLQPKANVSGRLVRSTGEPERQWKGILKLVQKAAIWRKKCALFLLAARTNCLHVFSTPLFTGRRSLRVCVCLPKKNLFYLYSFRRAAFLPPCVCMYGVALCQIETNWPCS